MQSTNFQPEMMDLINTQLKFVFENKYSRFYKEKFNSEICKLNSFQDFQNVPLLSKDEFLKVDLEKRTFVAPKDIAYYSISSGTTNNRKPTVIPHSTYYHHSLEKYQFDGEFFAKIGVTKILSLLPPMSSIAFRAATIPSKPAKIINGDIHNIAATVQIIDYLKIEGILTTITALDFIVAELKKISFDFDTIKWISIGGEACSTLRLNYFKEIFPSAYFYMRFGNSEIGGSRHYQCEHLHNNSHNSFHIDYSTELIEIVNENGLLVPFGEYGEIIHTDLAPKAFPLIRYKTRDIAKLEKKDCPCGNTYVLTIDGKSSYDSLKIFGTTLRSEIIADSLKNVLDLVETKFQLHVWEERTSTGIKPKFELYLKLKIEKNKDENSYLVEILSQKISSCFMISPSKSLQDLVEEGIYMPLKITLVENWPLEMKSRNIISHLK